MLKVVYNTYTNIPAKIFIFWFQVCQILQVGLKL